MDRIFNFISIATGLIGGVAASLWGVWDGLLWALVIVMCLDYATGLIKAVYTKTMSSEIGFKGLLKKIVILIIVALANVVQGITGVTAIREMVIIFYIANEGISILENAAVVSPNMPEKIKEVLLQLRDKGTEDKDDEDITDSRAR